jgi:GNAT superfamily N-acetyltransferase
MPRAVVWFLGMSLNLTIRRAGAHDACKTAALFSAALRSMAFFPKLHTDEEDLAFVSRFIAEDECWLAVEDGAVRGLACLEGTWLAHLYVHPDHHSRGIGTALLEQVKRERPDGFQLWTFQANAGARRFYERHGCTAEEFTDGSRNEEKLPDMRYVSRG